MVKYSCDRCQAESEKMNTAFTDRHIHLCDKCNKEWQSIIDNLQMRAAKERERLAKHFMQIDAPTIADESVIIPKASNSNFEDCDEITTEKDLLS